MKDFFPSVKDMQESLAYRYGIRVSEAFITCANRQLVDFFFAMTGLQPSNNIGVAFPLEEQLPVYYGSVSTLACSIRVRNNWNQTAITWRSHSGRVYQLGDEDVVCSDIVFSLEPLDRLLIRQQYEQVKKRSSVDEQWPFTVSLSEPPRESQLTLYVNKDAAAHRDDLIEQIDQFTKQYTRNMEVRNNADEDIVRYWSARKEGHYAIVGQFDGADRRFYEALFDHLRGNSSIVSVVVE